MPSVEAVIEAINAAYEAAGADLAFARFGGLDGAAVLIELVEIRYGAVRVTGNAHTDAGYVLGRAGARPGDLADLRRLEDRLGRFPETEDIRVDAALAPGAAEGSTDLTLTVTEPPNLRRTVSVDTLGSPDSGRLRLGTTLSVASLTGLRDPLSVSLTASEGALSGVFAYARPFGTEGARIGLTLTGERVRAVRAAAPLNDLRTRAFQAGIAGSLPLRATSEASDFLTFGLTHARDRSVLAGVVLTDQRTTELALGSSHVRRFPGRGLVALTHALRVGRLDDRVTPARVSYLRHEGSLSGLYALGADWTLGGEARWQAGSRTLPVFAQFSPLGRSGVRGYAAASGATDAGVLARLELRRAPVDLGRSAQLSPAVFADAGRGANRVGGAMVRGPLYRAVGLSLDLGGAAGRAGGFAGNLTLALPLNDALPRVRKGRVQAAASLSVQF